VRESLIEMAECLIQSGYIDDLRKTSKLSKFKEKVKEYDFNPIEAGEEQSKLI